MAETPSFTVDPFTQAYQALWAALFDALAGLDDLIEETNRTDLSAAAPEIPSNAECGQLPNVLLAQSDWSFSPTNSKAKELTQAYPLRIAIGTWSVTEINRVKWEALKALERSDVGANNLGLSFVRSVAVRTASDSPAREGENRGEEKWVTVANIVVTMCIPRESLLA